MYDTPSGKLAHHCECAPFLRNTKTLAKIVGPLALFMLFINHERELTQHLVAGASQHVVEEVCGVGVAVGTF
jgi:hypothetical protein